jgi:hypothetical protein
MRQPKVPTISQAKAALVRLLKAQGEDACPVCRANGQTTFGQRPVRQLRRRAFGNVKDKYLAHADGHFDTAADDWLGWASTAAVEGLTLLPDEWVTQTSADKYRDDRQYSRTWRFVMENHKAITEAGIRCEYRKRLYREIGSERYCVFIDSDFWKLLVDVGKPIKAAREYHDTLMGVIAETGRQGAAAAAEAPEAPAKPPRRKQKHSVAAPPSTEQMVSESSAPTPRPVEQVSVPTSAGGRGLQMPLFA